MANNSTGLQENIAGALCYLLGWVTGIIFYLLDSGRPFVKFHAVQSIITFGALTILGWVLTLIPVFGWFVSIVIWFLWFILWIFLMYKAYQGTRYKLPIIGDLAEKWAAK